jgi:hypothetical protein
MIKSGEDLFTIYFDKNDVPGIIDQISDILNRYSPKEAVRMAPALWELRIILKEFLDGD